MIATEIANLTDTFHVTIPGEVVGSQISLTVPRCRSCEFNLIDKFISNFAFLETKSLVLSKDQLAEIEQRSIKSQITNAFNSPTRTTDPTKFEAKFYGTPDKIYYLSDYTAFSKIEEVFREITTNISLRKEGSSHTLKLFGEKREVIESPLLLMNGRIIEDIDYIVNFDVSQIERIETVSERFHLGETYVDGIISFFLKNNSTIISDERKNFDYLPLDDLPITKNLTSKATRTPAYNRVLYWNPFVQFENGKVLDFNFESGDDKGIFQITFETLDKDGNMSRSTEEFEIK